MKIGCIVLQCYHDEHLFVGVECAKGRGLILPGGKYEPEKDETYQHCACREMYEETGIQLNIENLRYLWHGPDGFGYNCITFLSIIDAPWSKLNWTTPEGKALVVTWPELLNSSFKAYYTILKEIYVQHLRPIN